MRYDPEAAVTAIHESDRKRMVIGQLGQTLDGKVATPTGKSLYINGECALRHLHRLRASVDAVIVGVGTVIADDPKLTVRLCKGASPTRVIIDPGGRLTATRSCLHDNAAPVLVIHAQGARPAPLPAHIDRLSLSRSQDGVIDPQVILGALAARGLKRVLIEGGPTTLSLFLGADAIDTLHVMVAPKIFGSGRDGITLPAIDTLAEAIEAPAQTSLFDDGDVLFVCDLRRQAQSATRPVAQGRAG